MADRARDVEQVVLVCWGSDCKKAGARDLDEEVRDCLKRSNLKKSTLVVRTRCLDFCDDAPVACLQPSNTWLLKTTVKETRRRILALVGAKRSRGR